MKDDQFHPITPYKKGTRKSRDQSIKTEGIRMKRTTDRAEWNKYQRNFHRVAVETRTYKVWSYDKAPEEVKQKILENWRNNISGQDNWYAEDDGILTSKDQKIIGYEIFSGNMPKYWNVGYGHRWIQFELSIKDVEKFKKAFSIKDSLWNKIDVGFDNKHGESNTQIEFRDEIGGDMIDLDESYDNYIKYIGDEYKVDAITKTEFEELQKVKEKFDDLMHQSSINLENNYESEFTDESIIDSINSNDYRFTEDGKID